MASNTYSETMGTLLVGMFFNTFLYGLVMYQYITYYQTKFNDSAITKYTVFFLFVVDTFHSISVIYMAWCYTVTNFDNPAVLTILQWPYPFTPIATAITAFVTQTYLGIRVWRFTESKFLFAVIMVLAVPTFVLGVSCGTGAWIIWIYSELPRLTPLVIAWLVLQVTADSFISGTLIIAFSRSRTGSPRMDPVLNRLIRATIQTGVFAGIFSICDLISFVTLPGTNLHGMFAIPIGRIYTNTLMYTLISRDALKAELQATVNVSAVINALEWANTASDSLQGSGTFQSMSSVQVQVPKTVLQKDERSFCEDGEKDTPASV